MKGIALIILIACSGKAATAQFKAGSQLNNGGVMPFVEYRQEYKETSKRGRDWHFGPRAGYCWDVFSNRDYFYFQQTLRYKAVIFSPFWLRRYDKSIGYQVPISLGLHFDNFEVWGNYVYHNRSFDIHLTAYIK